MISYRHHYLSPQFIQGNRSFQNKRSIKVCEPQTIEFRKPTIPRASSLARVNQPLKVQIYYQSPNKVYTNNQFSKVSKDDIFLQKNVNQKIGQNINAYKSYLKTFRDITLNSINTANQQIYRNSSNNSPIGQINYQIKNPRQNNLIFQITGSSSNSNQCKDSLGITFENQPFFIQSGETSNYNIHQPSYQLSKKYSHQAFYSHSRQRTQDCPIANANTHVEFRLSERNALKGKHRNRREISNMTQRIKKAYQNKNKERVQDKDSHNLIQKISQVGKQSRGCLFRFLGPEEKKQIFSFTRKVEGRSLSTNKKDQSKQSKENDKMQSIHEIKVKLLPNSDCRKQQYKKIGKKHRRTLSNVQQSNQNSGDASGNGKSNVNVNGNQSMQKQNSQNSTNNRIPVSLYCKDQQIKGTFPQIIEQNQIQLSTKKIIFDQPQQKNNRKQRKCKTVKLQNSQNSQILKLNDQNQNMLTNLIQRKQKRTLTQIYFKKQDNRLQSQLLNFGGNILQNSIEQSIQEQKNKSQELKIRAKKQNSLFALKTNIVVSRTQCEAPQKIESTVIYECENQDILQKIGKNFNHLKVDYKAIVQIRPDQQNQKKADESQPKQKSPERKQNGNVKNKKERNCRKRMISIINQLPNLQEDKSEPNKYEKSVKFLQNRQFSDKQKISQYSIKSVRRINIPKQYQKGKFLGKGYFGQVFFGKHMPTGILCALKYLKVSRIKQEKMQESIERQIQCQIALNHPNICKIYEYFYDKHSDSLVLVVQYCEGKQLYHIMKEKRRLSEEQTAQIIHQLALAIEYMHKKHVIHRDLKPENIMISNGVTKLCDFGWAVMTTGSRKTICGTPLYSSPEIVLGKQYDKKVDLWGLGVLTYEMLIGRVPFKVYGQHQLHKIAQDQVTFPSWVDISGKAQDFILRILDKDPESRLNIFQIIDHPFLKRRKRVIERVSSVFPEFSSILVRD